MVPHLTIELLKVRYHNVEPRKFDYFCLYKHFTLLRLSTKLIHLIVFRITPLKALITLCFGFEHGRIYLFRKQQHRLENSLISFPGHPQKTRSPPLLPYQLPIWKTDIQIPSSAYAIDDCQNYLRPAQGLLDHIPPTQSSTFFHHSVQESTSKTTGQVQK